MSRQRKEPAKTQAGHASVPPDSSSASPHSLGNSPDLKARLAREQDEAIIVPLVEEELRADKNWKESGSVELRKKVQTRTERVPVDLRHEEVQIERVPINRVLASGEEAGPRQEGDIWVIPIIEEELVVTKRRIVREEVRIRKKQVMTRKQVTESLKREDIDIRTVGDLRQVGGETSPHAEGG